MEKSIKIEIPEGYEIDKAKSTFENIIFKVINEKLPKTWEELNSIKGYYIKNNSGVTFEHFFKTTMINKNIFVTKEQAEASLALAQLSQLREVYRDGWKPDYTNVEQVKYVIIMHLNQITTNSYNRLNQFLSFQSAEVRDLFLENFHDLIEKAKPLMY